MRDLEIVKSLKNDHEQNIIAAKENVKKADNDYENFKKEFRIELEEIRKNEIYKLTKKRMDDKAKKQNRIKNMSEELKIGDWVVVKTRGGNTAKKIISIEGSDKWGYSAYCAMPENLFYVNGYNKGKYKKPTWYYAEHQSRLSDRRIDLYAFNSIICRLTHDENKNVIIERFNG